MNASIDNRDLATSAYDFDLPPDLIAQFPAECRDGSRLLIMRGSEIQHALFSDLIGFLQRGDLLIRNNTRVIPARLYGRRATGGKVETLLIRPAGNVGDECAWVCLAKPLKNLRIGEEIIFGDDDEAEKLCGVLREKTRDGQAIFSFAIADAAKFAEILERVGKVPLPPYIVRPADVRDRERYQTVYAKIPGAVAAPTAGLHFTDLLWKQIADAGIDCAEITLHVGMGTFKPVATDNFLTHKMDGENYFIEPADAEKINRAKKENRRIIAVGTTSARAVESAAITAEKRGESAIVAGSGVTDLFIFPGYRWRVINGLLTNFHLPKSTLIALVAALVGREKILAAYREAVEKKYRFYSYGDACLITS